MVPYGAKIRSLTISNATSEDVLRHLAISRPTLHLFPNLRTLTWIAEDSAILSCVQLFLSPSLRAFYMLGEAISSLTKHAVLESLQKSCPKLCSLHIGPDKNESLEEESLFALKDLVGALEDLEDFWCSTARLDPDTLACLLAKRALKRLAFFLANNTENGPVAQPIQNDTEGFSSLTELAISVVGSVASVAPFLRSISRPSLNNFHVTVGGTPQPNQFHDFCNTLATFHALTHVTIVLPSTARAQIPLIVDEPIIRPLLCLASIEHFDITSSYISITRDLLNQMARHWPKLRYLDLSPNHYHRGPKAALDLIDLSTVAFVAATCRSLQWLGLHLNASIELVKGPLPHGNRTLTTLKVYSSKIADDLRTVARVAFLLRTLFPNVGLHYSSENASHIYSANLAGQRDWVATVTMHVRRWKEVVILLEELKSARAMLFML